MKKIKYFALLIKKWIPFRWAFLILFLIILFILSITINNNNDLVDNHPYYQIFGILGKVLLLFTISIIILALLSLLTTYIRFKQRLEQSSSFIEVQLHYPEQDSKQVSMHVNCKFGTYWGTGIAVAIHYKQGINSAYKTMQFAHSKKDKKRSIAAIIELQLPTIQQYNTEQLCFAFTDIFGLFIFKIYVPTKHLITLLPIKEERSKTSFNPHQASDQLVLTNEIRKQEGEWIHFKSFESSDDIRRVVWQIYARTKELVVRRPEIYNFYSSQLDVYATFFNTAAIDNNNELNNILLKVYKTAIWSFLQALQLPEGTHLRLMLDQEITVQKLDTVDELIRLQIGALLWQNKQTAQHYLNTNVNGLYFITSLTPVEQLYDLAKSHHQSKIIYVQFSSIFEQRMNFKQIMTDIFIENDDTRLVVKWLSWSKTNGIAANEQKIKELFERSQHEFISL